MLSKFLLHAYHGDIAQPHYVTPLRPDICLIEFFERADCGLPTMIKEREGVSEGSWLALCMWK